ncbi:hypothetical protein [Caldimonas brevitalea]|nr:hypothetical protein [Caldimonas brevitalea]
MSPLRARSTHKTAAWLLASALLLVQVLGLVHGVQHAKRGPALATVVAQEVGGAAAVGDDTALFGHRADDPACRLYDGLAGADLALPDAVAWARCTPDALPPPLPRAFTAAIGSRHFDARAPPRG